MVYSSVSGEGGPSEREHRRHLDGHELVGYSDPGRRIGSAREHGGSFAFSSGGAGETVSYSAVMRPAPSMNTLLSAPSVRLSLSCGESVPTKPPRTNTKC